MYRTNLFRNLSLFAIPLLLNACQSPDFGQIKNFPSSLIDSGKQSLSLKNIAFDNSNVNDTHMNLGEILDGSLANQNQGSDFTTVIKHALETDPAILSKRRDVEAKLAVVDSNKAQKDFQVGTTLYGGIEDITDDTKGLALSVSASRLLFDGGKADSQIESTIFAVEAAKMNLTAAADGRIYELCSIWLELEKYKTLREQIDKRLEVLDPLISQLEQVAKAGIGDVSKVAAAQRTVSTIRVEQTNIYQGLAQAQLRFSNAFGPVNKDIVYDYDFISYLIPEQVNKSLAQKSPALLAQYASYQSSVSRVKALKAKEGFDIGFEARAMRPFAGSGKDSDESIGFVGRKTLFNGGMLESEIREAEAIVGFHAAQIKATYRDGAKSLETALQNIDSMDQAILLARDNAQFTADEIVYLKQQLVIGGSTLDSVLAAEARLYEAESKEIKFSVEKHKSELIIASMLGLLSTSFGF